MKIAFVTHYDLSKQSNRPSHLVGNFGSSYYMAKSLEQQGETLIYISPLIEQHNFSAKIISRFYQLAKIKNYYYWTEPSVSKNYALQIKEKISQINPDVIFCPHANLIAYLNTKIPIFLWTDSLYAGILDAFPSGYPSAISVKNLTQLDQLTIQKCRLLIFSSEWAAQTVLKTYKADSTKIKVVPTGANLETHRTFEEIQVSLSHKTFDICKLLFIGVNWKRKGGDIALEVAEKLNQQGLKTELYLVGCQPSENKTLPDFVHSLGFINRSTESGQKQIEKLYAESHFLVLPSRSDCTPAVLREAGAFGLPCLTSNVGGIPTLIRDDYNGKIFDINAEVSEYCDYITQVFGNSTIYRELAFASYKEYETRLNWHVAGQQVKRLITEFI